MEPHLHIAGEQGPEYIVPFDPNDRLPASLAIPTGVLVGEQLHYRQIAKLAHDAGFKDEKTLQAVAICLAETAGYTEAYNPDNPDGSKDYGLMQINSVHLGETAPDGRKVTVDLLYDPVFNFEMAWSVYKHRSYTFNAWAAYTSGRWLQFKQQACQGIYNMWREKYGLLA